MLRSLGYFDSAEHGAGLGGVYVPGSKPATLAGNATYGPNGSGDKSPVGRGSLAGLERGLRDRCIGSMEEAGVDERRRARGTRDGPAGF
jgi:hypothetical protein